MRNLPTPALPSTAPRQLNILFDSVRLRGMNPSERRTVLVQLASLLSEATGIASGEHDDDER